MKKILIVFGTRPEAIKMAPLINEFKKYTEIFDTKICVTAQHREMLDQVLKLFEVQPDYDLNIMSGGQDLYDITSKVLLGMRNVLNEVKPHLVLVHGDTSTSMVSALAAYYQQIPIGHIEAGLRTYNIYSPWPEEINRQLTGRMATYNFAPTLLSKQNLKNEGVEEENIHVTGNTVIDALRWVINKIKNTPDIENKIINQLMEEGISNKTCDLWLKKERKMILITGHRRENFGQGFINICEALKELSESNPNIDFVYPMHLNPNVRNAIMNVFGESIMSNNSLQNIKNTFFLEPLDYLPFVYLMNLSYLILTDSGGIQEEAPGLGKPVLVMRDTTERPEAINAGTVKLVGTDKVKIIQEVTKLIYDAKIYNLMSKADNPYGDGMASKRIVEILKDK